MISDVDLNESYERDLRAFMLKPSEEGLALAYAEGRRALDGGMSLVAFADMHWRVFEKIARRVTDGSETSLSASFFAEAAAPYEMALRGYRESSQVLEKANAQLKRANLMKTRFFNYLNHELRTPLNSVLGFAELIGIERVGPLTELQRRYQGNILAGGTHMLTLVNEMLDMAKIEAGKMQVAREEVDLEPIIMAAIEQTASIATRAGIVVVFDPVIEVHVLGDPQRLLQVFLNLLGNALKFTPKDGTVTIRARVSGGEAKIDVIDDGIGIPPDKLEDIFDEFAQAEMFAAAAPLSTGLGLPLTRGLLKLMHGSIVARSEHGVGSTFSIALPLFERRRKDRLSLRRDRLTKAETPAGPSSKQSRPWGAD